MGNVDRRYKPCGSEHCCYTNDREYVERLEREKAELVELVELVIKAIDDEPELDDDMPDEMWHAISTDRSTAMEAMRLCVRLTKQGIKERFKEQSK